LRESREKYFRLAWRRKTRRSWSVEEKPTCTSVRRRPRFVQRPSPSFPQAQQKTVLHSLSARKRQQQQQRRLRRASSRNQARVDSSSSNCSALVWLCNCICRCVRARHEHDLHPMRGANAPGGQTPAAMTMCALLSASKCFLLFATLWIAATSCEALFLSGSLWLWLALRPARGGCLDGLGKYER
jgi:hypothetical protein